MKNSASVDLAVVLRYEKFCLRRLGCCLTENSVSIDLIVAFWKISAPMDLIVVLWKVLFPWTWLLSYEKFYFHGLGCRPMENSVPWIWLSSYGKFLFHGLGCRPMENSCSHGLGCYLMRYFDSIDLSVVL
jgi:hypothetical protein